MPKDSSSTIDYIRCILEKLSCPYLEDSSEQWLAELLLHASEARLKLLHWIIVTYDGSFTDFLNNSLPVISSRLDSRHQKLLLVLNMMCVCKIDDMEIVKGTASQKKQLQFWKNLAEMCHISQFGLPYSKSEPQNNASYYLKPAIPPTVNESFNKTCKFIDTFANTIKLGEVFANPKSVSQEESISVPEIDMLMETGENMRKLIQTTIENFYHLKKTDIDIERLDQSLIENYCRKIDLSLNMFSQMIDNFIHCYDSEIEAWCNKSKPILSDIGDIIHNIDPVFMAQVNFFETIHELKHTITSLNGDIIHDLDHLKETLNADVVLLNEFHNEKSILEDSLWRLKQGI